MNLPLAALSLPAPEGRGLHVRLLLAETLFGIFPPFTLARTRRLALKACGVRMGRASFFWGMPRLMRPQFISSRLRIGTDCGFNDACVFDLAAPITIGNHVGVGHEVRFLTGSRREGVGIAAPITVGDGVWIGARCTLMGGVAIGAGAVIGAGITVTTDIPPNTLVTGEKSVSLAKWR
jgi:acetyltransferase-like isoleucine patch superfamily enzyme